MQIASFVIAIVALVAAAVQGLLQLRTSRQANSLPVLVELFAEHRSAHLAEARQFVYNRMGDYANIYEVGLDALPPSERELLTDLSFYYDNLGTLVAHGVVPIEPISGYLGGSVLQVWDAVEELVLAERRKRGQLEDPSRWQVYFENLAVMVKETPPAAARKRAPCWRLAEG